MLNYINVPEFQAELIQVVDFFNYLEVGRENSPNTFFIIW